ncbi:MAG: hypothetical protein ACLPN6_27790 [Streptosporangiaceae bacterium]
MAAGRPARLAWQNEVGGLTFEVGAGSGRCFVKWAPPDSGLDLPARALRLIADIPPADGRRHQVLGLTSR